MIISALVVEIQNMTGSMAQNVAETAMNITTNAATSEANIEVVKEAEVVDVVDGMIATDTKTIESEIGTPLKGIDEVGHGVHPVVDSGEVVGKSDPTALLVDRLSPYRLDPRYKGMEDLRARLIVARTNLGGISDHNHRKNRHPHPYPTQPQLNHRHLPVRLRYHSQRIRRRRREFSKTRAR